MAGYDADMDIASVVIAAFGVAGTLGGLALGGRQADRRARIDEERAWRDRAGPVLARIDLIMREVEPSLFQSALNRGTTQTLRPSLNGPASTSWRLGSASWR